MSNPWYFTTLRPAFCQEDYSDTITVAGSGSIATWTLVAELVDSGNNLVDTPTVSIVDPTARTVLVSITGQDFTTAADYTLTLYRTDTGSRTMVAWATLEVTDPTGQLGWGAGFYQGS